jgi:DNA polymerase
MDTDHAAALRAVLAFYADAGVDAVLDATPVNRLTAFDDDSAPAPAPRQAAPARPRPSAVPAGARHGGPAAGAAPAADPATPPPPPAADAVMAAREAAASAQTLEELRALLDGFEGCPLRFSATRLVFADGNPRARVMIVGEAPGRDEDLAGLPFVGRSGQLLDRMLAAIGLDRTTVYIANLVPWRPPGNRTPTPLESQTCLPFLKRQIELADPDFLLCLGAPASATLLGTTEGIRRSRGRWRSYHTGTREIRALASFHPSYLLRSPIEKRFAWRDFLSLRAALVQSAGKSARESGRESARASARDPSDTSS